MQSYNSFTQNTSMICSLECEIWWSFCLDLVVYFLKRNDGFEVLAFPCNNFGSQEPGTNEEIQVFAGNKGATFPVLGKLECENGNSTHPLYQFLRGNLPLLNSLKWLIIEYLFVF